MMTHFVIPMCVIALVTSVVASGLAYAAMVQRQHDNERHTVENTERICQSDWERFDGRDGIRAYAIARLNTDLDTIGVHEPLRTRLLEAETALLDRQLPALPPPECPRPSPSSPT